MTRRLAAALLLAGVAVTGWAAPAGASTADNRAMCVAVEPTTGYCLNLPVPRVPNVPVRP